MADKAFSGFLMSIVLASCAGSSNPSSMDSGPGDASDNPADGAPENPDAGASVEPDSALLDSAIQDGALPDGAMIDAGSPPVSCPGLAYCDDFERYGGAITDGESLGPWKASVAALTMTIDTVKPYRGTQSLHITMPGSVNCGTGGVPCHAVLNQRNAAGLVMGNNMFGRAMVFYSNTSGNGLPIGVHSWIFSASGMSSATAGAVSMNMGGGGAKLQLNYSPGDQSVQGGTMTAGTWHCVQWEYDGSGSPPRNQAKVSIDGTLAISIPATEGWNAATPWNNFNFGFTHYQTLANPVEVFLDEFALSDAMIPCP
jgi:hypothetical protein